MNWIGSVNWENLGAAVATVVAISGVGMSLGIYAIKKVTGLLSRWQEALSVSERLNFEREEKLYTLIERIATRLSELRSSVEENNQQITTCAELLEKKPAGLVPIEKVEAVLTRLEEKERKHD